MRVTTAFKRLLRLPGASIVDVSFTSEGVVVTVALRGRRRRVCSRCGQTGEHLQIHDRRVKRWRHLDLGRTRCVIECELRRLRCPDCGVHLEAVPWARGDAHHTRDFEDVVAWLAQQMAKTQIAGLLRIAWDTVGEIVQRVVAEHLDESRLDGLVAIGVDEISYRRHHRYLTSVVDHERGGIVWCAPGRNAQTLQRFFDLLGERRRHSIKAVSIDMSGGYEKAINHSLPGPSGQLRLLVRDRGYAPEVFPTPLRERQRPLRTSYDPRNRCHLPVLTGSSSASAPRAENARGGELDDSAPIVPRTRTRRQDRLAHSRAR